jgi:DNA mismatch repair protein MutL
VIAYAIKQADAVKDGETRPALILFIDLDPAKVDVNVHPAKREVRFNKASEVREAVITTLRSALTQRAQASHPAESSQSPADAGCAPDSGLRPVPGVSGGQHPPLRGRLSLRSLDAASAATVVPVKRDEIPEPSAVYPETPPPAPAPAAPVEADDSLIDLPEESSPWKWCRVVGELRGRYILLETDSGCVTVDPRAAMERILYEKLLSYTEDQPAVSQVLLIPETVKMSPADAERLRRSLDVVEAMGFKVADFGDDHFMVEALPGVLGELSCRELLQNIVSDISHAGKRRGSVKWKEELVARAVSRTGALRAFKYSPQEAENLVKKLASARMPYTCPQGKPTMIFSSYRELDRKFGKK